MQFLNYANFKNLKLCFGMISVLESGVPKLKRGVSNSKKALNLSYDKFIFPVKLFLNDEKRNIPDIEEEHT